ncbi:hypothetical protein NEOLEDRAFT_1151832 [Neolentinus lepideus HHB14362 ss-1]|uniref:Uncharacterized protein n=1 Tax=Neolentinus lepideus HHB14362 ss-1 TaxID=1314782 RepID=A0A165NJA7_9AGAM|nr:hypothetical protein NEOLEDRAFT_1151832 [Neolentinus lepideus HHB14362 ss-1]
MASKDDASESKDVPWSSAEILDSLRLFIPLMVPLGKTSGNIALIATFFASLQAQLLSAIPSDGSVLVHVFFYSSIFIHIFAAFFGALATMLFDMPPPRAEPELPPGVMPSGSTMLLDVEWDLCPPSFYLAIPVVGGFAFLFLAFIGVVAGITVTVRKISTISDNWIGDIAVVIPAIGSRRDMHGYLCDSVLSASPHYPILWHVLFYVREKFACRACQKYTPAEHSAIPTPMLWAASLAWANRAYWLSAVWIRVSACKSGTVFVNFWRLYGIDHIAGQHLDYVRHDIRATRKLGCARLPDLAFHVCVTAAMRRRLVIRRTEKYKRQLQTVSQEEFGDDVLFVRTGIYSFKWLPL